MNDLELEAIWQLVCYHYLPINIALTLTPDDTILLLRLLSG